MKVGFTGTRNGINKFQWLQLAQFIAEETIEEAHHGDCIGADEAFHDLIMNAISHIRLDAKIILHPPGETRLRAFCATHDAIPPKPYLERNRDIVDATDVLIVCPGQETETLRSGTWSTYRYALKLNRPIHLITPTRHLRR